MLMRRFEFSLDPEAPAVGMTTVRRLRQCITCGLHCSSCSVAITLSLATSFQKCKVLHQYLASGPLLCKSTHWQSITSPLELLSCAMYRKLHGTHSLAVYAAMLSKQCHHIKVWKEVVTAGSHHPYFQWSAAQTDATLCTRPATEPLQSSG